MLNLKYSLVLLCMLSSCSSCTKKRQTEYDFKDFKMADESVIVEEETPQKDYDHEYAIKLRVVRRSYLI
jgi:hypothetical protein